ncbi:MAG: vitamin K epoxide reductase family protein [Phycisphaerae bacterium]
MSGVPEATPAAQQSPIRRRSSAWLDGAIVLLCAAGWWLSIDLWRIGMGIAATNPILAAQCNPAADAVTDCSSVLASSWASVSIGSNPNAPRVPLAALGAAYFTAVGLWFLFVGRVHPRRWAWAIPVTLLVLYGGFQSLYSINIMSSVLGRWCIGCVWVHALNAVIVMLALASFPWTRRRSAEPIYPHHNLAAAGATCGLLALMLFPTYALLIFVSASANQMSREYERIIGDPQYIAIKYTSQPLVEVPLGDEPPSLGNADAQLTLVAFVDFECSVCKQLRTILTDLATREPQTYCVHFKHYPLDQSCNPHAKRTAHGSACLAARAYEAARIVGGTDAARTLRGVLYQRQREIAPQYIDEWARTCGIDPTKFKAAINSPEALAPINDDTALGKSLGVEAVPVLFVNGRRFDQWRTTDAFDKLLPVINEMQKR